MFTVCIEHAQKHARTRAYRGFSAIHRTRTLQYIYLMTLGEYVEHGRRREQSTFLCMRACVCEEGETRKRVHSPRHLTPKMHTHTLPLACGCLQSLETRATHIGRSREIPMKTVRATFCRSAAGPRIDCVLVGGGGREDSWTGGNVRSDYDGVDEFADHWIGSGSFFSGMDRRIHTHTHRRVPTNIAHTLHVYIHYHKI